MIEIEKVCVDFTAGRGTPTRAVDDVSLHIAAGEIFGIVGTSGAGKSTLLRTLNALTRPSQGASTSTAWKFRRWTEKRYARRGSVLV